MRARLAARWMRRSDGGELLEWFLVSGISSVLVIRWFLALTGYPKIGGGGLHIAHMLWGGLLMLAALVLFFLFLDRRVHRAAAVIAGLGLGTFVDEIGKFVTSDNDYFYRPAIVLIYLLFVALFILSRAVEAERPLTPAESLANAMDVAEPRAGGPLDAHAHGLAKRLLDRADPADPLVPALRAWLARGTDRPAADTELDRVEARGARLYRAAIANPLFERALIAVMLVDAGAAIVGTITLVTLLGGPASEAATVAGAGQTISSLVGALLVLRGIIELRRSRAGAYRWFRRGVLTWILVTQVFVFYTSQLAGVAGLGIQVLTYAVLTYMLGRELTHGGAPPGDED